MKPLISLLLLLSGAAFEALACYVLFRNGAMAGDVHIIIFMGLHALATALLTAAVLPALPVNYRQSAVAAMVFIFSMCLFIPILGMVGGVAALVLGLYSPGRDRLEDWEQHDAPVLPYKPVTVTGDSVFTRGGLNTVLMHFDDPNWRERAVMASRHLPNRNAIPILQATLKDSSDEVRLLAYTLLSTKERDIESQIESLNTRLNRGGHGPDWVHEGLAHLYWELAYLGLVEGEVRKYVLGRALMHVDIALKALSTPSRHFLRGRICLRLGHLEECATSLDAAEHSGLSADDIAPYRAELAFLEQRYDRVPRELARISPEARTTPVLDALANYWL